MYRSTRPPELSSTPSRRRSEEVRAQFTLVGRRALRLSSKAAPTSLREPCRHKIVFEGKYFSNGSLTYAQKELVGDIYQAFFYRGLPFVPQTRRGRAKWDYDYSCLLAYDASPMGTLKAAWEAFPRL